MCSAANATWGVKPPFSMKSLARQKCHTPTRSTTVCATSEGDSFTGIESCYLDAHNDVPQPLNGSCYFFLPLYYGRIAMTSSPQCQQCSNLEEARAGNATISKEQSKSTRSRTKLNAEGDRAFIPPAAQKTRAVIQSAKKSEKKEEETMWKASSRRSACRTNRKFRWVYVFFVLFFACVCESKIVDCGGCLST